MDLPRQTVSLGQKPALLLVDMVEGFTSSACPLGTDCPEVVEANRQLLDVFHQRGLPVVFTTVVYHNEEQAKVFRQRIPALNVLTPDSDWVKIDARLSVQPQDLLVEKQWASSFHQTGLAQRLRDTGVDSLVVTGLTTSGCVRATVVDALQHDFPVVVVEEAVGDRNADAHAANLHDMHAKYAEVSSLSAVIAMLP